MNLFGFPFSSGFGCWCSEKFCTVAAQLCISGDTKQRFIQRFCNAGNCGVSLKDVDHQFSSLPSELITFLRTKNQVQYKKSSKLCLWPPMFWKRKIKYCLFLTFKQMITWSGTYFRAWQWTFLFKVKDGTAWTALLCLWCTCLALCALRNSSRNAWMKIKAHLSKFHSILY